MNVNHCASPSLDFFKQSLENEPSLLIETLWDAPKAALAAIALEVTKKNIIIISGGTREDRLFDDLTYFSGEDILEFPAWETLPGEEIPPSPDIVGKRFEILYRLSQEKTPRIILCPIQSCLQKVLSPETLAPLCRRFKRGESYPFNQLAAYLTSLGYRRSSVASDKGEFALRGGILDIFPISSTDPYRLDFFGDAIDQIRIYDPIGQKSISKTDSLFLSPAWELDLLKQQERLSWIFDYLGQSPLIIFDDLLALEDRYASLKSMPGASSRYFASFPEFFEKVSHFSRHYWTHERAEELGNVHIDKKLGRDFYTGKQPLQPLSFSIFDREILTKRWLHPFREVSDFFSLSEEKTAATSHEILQGIKRFSKSALELHFICATESDEKTLKERLKTEDVLLPSSTFFDSGYLSSGLVVEDAHFALVPMTEFTRRYRTRRQKWRNTYHTPASDFHELSPGDIVVHFHNGIGKYLGMERRLNHIGAETEFLVIEYSSNSKLYVPVAQSHLVSRYIGAHEEMPVLSTLGSGRWQRTKLQAQKAIIGYAQDLLRISAERTLKGGFPFPPDSDDLRTFEDDFPFNETEDQLNAIADVKNDMLSSKAMDRLICGDVGYGKTEVAMRAAFKAVVDGKKQVAVLVPTTVLAMQHFESFRDRMANFAINIGVLSRFCSPKEIKETLKKAADGTVDIVIGTHRLISKDVVFKDLGLLIIDEEQRFGVRAKEHLKAIKAGVDCLTLSATPIPRTLYLSLIGARSISVINTPPQDRLPIKTIIAESDSQVIQNALLRELSRDGQAFFIHNRVESIFSVTEQVQKLLPEAKIVTAHGQMSPDEIDTVFHAFKNGSADILVATTIVENGIDIPNANTILIDRADQFGLADLYQLRGRVGRWNKPAYAYFLTPQKRQLPELTRKRLHAMLESSGYGGGMKIAMRDLEIRGAGDILGTQQSGQIAAIGFHLYCKLLKRTVDALQRKVVPSFNEVKMEFAYPARLPDAYIHEGSLRLEMYHRLGDASSFEEVDALLDEMKDRFGEPPDETIWLYHLTRLRVFAAANHFTLLKFETYTLTAEWQKGKATLKKTLPLPKSKSPADLEKGVIALLKKEFTV